MSDSLFGDLDIESASDDPFGVGIGTWPFSLRIEPKTSEKGNVGILFHYDITEGEYQGNTASEWKTVRGQSDDEKTKKRNASFIKQRLTQLGIPVERQNSLTPDEMDGIEGWVTIGEPRGGYTNIVRVSLSQPSEPNADAAQAAVDNNPFEV